MEEEDFTKIDSFNEFEDDKLITDDDGQVLPAYMSSVIRRQFLQEMVKALPPPMQSRIVALKNLQLEQLKLEVEFFEEVYNLEKKYQMKYQPLFDKRRDIINGKLDTPNEVPKWKGEIDLKSDFVEQDFSKSLKDVKSIPADAKGIPNFWLTIFHNSEILSELLQDHDEPAIKKLTDITIKYDDEHSYTLEFHFDKNEYFSNEVLTKQYFLKSAMDEDYPFAFEGPEIYKCKGCVINWEKKMNLTVKTIRKKQKHKERGAVRVIVKQVPTDSFFNFFDPPEVPANKEEMDDETQAILASDFEIGHFLRARIIPKAVLYYTGDIVDDEDDEDDDFEGDEESESEDEKASDLTYKKKSAVKDKDTTPIDCKNQ